MKLSSNLLLALIGVTGFTQASSAEPAGLKTGSPASIGVPAAGRPTAEECAVRTADNAAACDSLFATMLEYQKRMNKEAREDARIQRTDRQRALDAAAAKISADNKAIDGGMEESREKASALRQDVGGTVNIDTGAVAKPPSAAAAAEDVSRVTGVQCADPSQQPPCGR